LKYDTVEKFLEKNKIATGYTGGKFLGNIEYRNANELPHKKGAIIKDQSIIDKIKSGNYDPIVITEINGVEKIVDGWHRLATAQENGIDKVKIVKILKNSVSKYMFDLVKAQSGSEDKQLTDIYNKAHQVKVTKKDSDVVTEVEKEPVIEKEVFEPLFVEARKHKTVKGFIESQDKQYVESLISKDKSGIEYPKKIKIEGTGEEVTVTKDVSEILRENSEDEDNLRDFLDCVEGL